MQNKPVDKNITKKISQLQEEKKQLLQLPAQEALARILSAAEPAALVHAISEQDFYFLVHDIGPQDALPVLGYASRRQWEFLFDMEIWQRDRMDIPAAARWIERLNRADAQRSLAWLVENKTDLLEFILFNNIEVRLREHDQDPGDFEEGYFTLDNVFYVRPHPLRFPPPDDSIFQDPADAEPARDFIEKFVRALADYDYVTYQRMLLEATSLIPAETEEGVYRMRCVRLAEKGFLPFDEAVSVYRPLAVEDLLRQKSKFIAAEPEPELMAGVPVTTTASIEPENLFARSLAAVASDAVLRQLQAEFATLCNQLIVADQKKVLAKKDLKPTIKKASGYLSIGLRCIHSEIGRASEPSPARMAEVLQRYPLIGIFQVGFKQALVLKWRSEKWVARSWFADNGLALTFWGENWLGVLGGLLLKKPLYFDNYRSGQMYRDFQTVEDIETTSADLDSIINFDRLLGQLNIELPPVPSDSFLTFKNLMLTQWVRYERDLSPGTVPLPLAQFKAFFETLWTGNDGKRRILPQRKTDFLRWLSQKSGRTLENLSDQYGLVLENLFKELEAEYAGVLPENLAPRYIHLFLIEK